MYSLHICKTVHKKNLSESYSTYRVVTTSRLWSPRHIAALVCNLYYTMRYPTTPKMCTRSNFMHLRVIVYELWRRKAMTIYNDWSVYYIISGSDCIFEKSVQQCCFTVHEKNIFYVFTECTWIFPFIHIGYCVNKYDLIKCFPCGLAYNNCFLFWT